MSEDQASDQPIVEDPAPTAEDPPKDDEPQAKPEPADQEAPPSDKEDQGGAEGGDKETVVTTHSEKLWHVDTWLSIRFLRLTM